jgi:hypothetical protein
MFGPQPPRLLATAHTGFVGFESTATPGDLGDGFLSTSNRFPLNSCPRAVSPVMLPPGRARLRNRGPGCRCANLFQPPPTSPLKSTGASLLRIRRADIPWPEPFGRAAGRRRGMLREFFAGIKAAPIALSESLDASPKELIGVARQLEMRNDFYTSVYKRYGACIQS